MIILGYFFPSSPKKICCPTEVLLMSTYDMHFYGEIREKISELLSKTPP